MGAIINHPAVVLICSAIPEEQEQLNALPISGIELVPIVCGVGNVAAAISLAEYLASNPAPDEILFVGSAGTYKQRRDEFGIGFSSRFFQRELAVARGESSRPGLLPASIETEQGVVAVDLAKGMKCIPGSTNCPDSITLVHTGSLFDDLAFENMECYGLASVAERHKLPFTALFALTNVVGPAGSDSWRKNYRSYSQELQKGIVRYFTSPEQPT